MAKNTLREQRRIERERRQRRNTIVLFGSIAVLLGFVALVVLLQINRPKVEAKKAEGTATAAVQTAQANQPLVTPVAVGTPSDALVVTTDSGLQYQDEVVGTGAEAVTGSSVTVHYSGWLMDGTPFDSSRGREPYTLTLGERRVIPGWEEGLQGMKVGGIRKLVIPPELGYGAQANGSIPANSTLVFEVELIDVR
jgi:FKBP-type peptidyl-prolyl cis-trans isomerase FkpA